MDQVTRWRFGSNKLINTKYTWFNFVPIVLFNQFKFFFNLFFLIVALSQFVDSLRVGFLISYIGPLVFVLVITMVKEAYDDAKRANRDSELNGRLYKKIDVKAGLAPMTASKDLQVGDIIQINEGERVPADIVLLKTTEK
jgi:phospholipid-translocating ATPase